VHHGTALCHAAWEKKPETPHIVYGTVATPESMWNDFDIPVVPHKAVAEVSKIGNL